MPRTPRAKPNTPALDPGERAVRFISNLTLVGDYLGQPFDPRDWQKDCVRRTFKTRPDGRRQYRRVFYGLPRKQAKTTLAAGMGGYLVFGECEGKRGQQVYSASGDHKQATLIFKTLASMIEADPTLSRLATVYHGYKRIEVPSLGNTFESLSSDAALKHGLSPSAVIFDEVHVLPNRDLHDVLTTGFGARKDPLTIYITTAGWDQHSLCYDLWTYAEKVRDGVIDDPTFLPILYAADRSDDWTDEAVWHKAMPALGDFCSLEFIRDEFRRAKELPSFENTFRQLYLNQWTEQAERWLSLERWRSCEKPGPIPQGTACYAGFDKGATGDMSAFAALFPDGRGGFDCRVRFWAPEDGRWRHEPRNRDLYLLWARQGFLTLTEGEAIDDEQVEREIAAFNEVHPIRLLCADRAYAELLLSRLYNRHEIPTKGIPQGPVTLNEPMVLLETLLLSSRFRHDGNPVLTWNAANASCRRNATGLMHIDKSGSTGRIDGLAAVIDALAASKIGGGEDDGDSVYNSRGILVL